MHLDAEYKNYCAVDLIPIKNGINFLAITVIKNEINKTRTKTIIEYGSDGISPNFSKNETIYLPKSITLQLSWMHINTKEYLPKKDNAWVTLLFGTKERTIIRPNGIPNEPNKNRAKYSPPNIAVL